jgi:predicted Zn-dependent protease
MSIRMQKLMIARAAACLVSLTALAQGMPVSPFATVPQRSGLFEEEGRIWDDAADADKALRRRGSLFGDAKIDAYLQSVLDGLYPEFKGAVRVRTLSDPDLNAFAMPNGSIYMHLGLLARLENEAQLAAVLAHEGAHFVYRHGYQRMQNVKSNAAFALGLGVVGNVAGAGVLGPLGQLAAVSSIYGFSREHEREADRVGFERMVQLGYDPRQGARVFEILRDEVKLMDIKQPFMFASHPKLEERIESFNELRAQHPTAGSLQRTEEERFLSVTRAARPAWIEQAFGFSRYKSLIHVLSQPGVEKRFPAHFQYHLGEAYRLRNESEDVSKALQSYRMAMQSVPEYVQTYRALGLLYMQENQKEEARAMFEKYLTVQPNADDAAFVKTYLQQIQ